MGYWVCEAMRSRFDAQVAVMNGGGLRKGFPAGQATVQDFWDLMPFDNTAIVFKVSGKVLRKIIDHGIDSAAFGNGQFSGLVVRYDPGRAFENKILSMTLADGSPVGDGGEYSVVTNDFMFLNGGDGYTMMPSADKASYVETFVPIRDVLIDRAKRDGRMSAEKVDVLVPSTR
jgi:2',3'-cyclic-nucleotide 2'-phosphodiesterase (5'-nucleotidase family)